MFKEQTHSSEVQRRAMNAIGALPPLNGQVVKKAARREAAQGTGREAEETKQPARGPRGGTSGRQDMGQGRSNETTTIL